MIKLSLYSNLVHNAKEKQPEVTDYITLTPEATDYIISVPTGSTEK